MLEFIGVALISAAVAGVLGMLIGENIANTAKDQRIKHKEDRIRWLTSENRSEERNRPDV